MVTEICYYRSVLNQPPGSIPAVVLLFFYSQPADGVPILSLPFCLWITTRWCTRSAVTGLSLVNDSMVTSSSSTLLSLSNHSMVTQICLCRSVLITFRRWPRSATTILSLANHSMVTLLILYLSVLIQPLDGDPDLPLPFCPWPATRWWPCSSSTLLSLSNHSMVILFILYSSVFGHPPAVVLLFFCWPTTRWCSTSATTVLSLANHLMVTITASNTLTHQPTEIIWK